MVSQNTKTNIVKLPHIPFCRCVTSQTYKPRHVLSKAGIIKETITKLPLSKEKAVFLTKAVSTKRVEKAKTHNANTLSLLVNKINKRLFFQKERCLAFARLYTFKSLSLAKSLVLQKKAHRERLQIRDQKNHRFYLTNKATPRSQGFYHEMMDVPRVVKTKSTHKNSKKTRIYTISVHSSRNNTLLTLSGDRVVKGGWTSAGKVGFKNCRKSTTYASQAAAKRLALTARQLGIRAIKLKLYGTGHAKGAVVRTLQQSSLRVCIIQECTPAVHNGCRPAKSRRV